MLNHDTYAALIKRGRSAGADYVEVYAERWRRRLLRSIDANVEEATSSLLYGAGIRLFFGTDVVYGYTNDLSDAALGELLGNLLAVRTSANGAAGVPDARAAGASTYASATPARSFTRQQCRSTRAARRGG